MLSEGVKIPNTRSPIRWAGSKAKLVPALSSYWHASGAERYLEAFCGSAAFFFNVEPGVALLNDLNGELVNSLRVFRDHPLLLHSELMDVQNSEEKYYRLRAADVSCLDDFERSVRFFYLNRYCFNGIYRTNLKGGFNVPYGGKKTGAFPGIADWTRASRLLRNVRLSQQDFEVFVEENVRRGDFVYLDPPYAVSNRRIFSQYSENSFGLSDMERLSRLLVRIDSVGARFLVSYAQSPESKMLARDWFIQRQFAQRNVAGFATHRRRALEVFISNFEP